MTLGILIFLSLLRYNLLKLSHTHSSLWHFLMLQLLGRSMTTTTAIAAIAATTATAIATPRCLLVFSHDHCHLNHNLFI
ncbi:hypothetical protein Hanom_Chr12g01107481 [Helianthus anomalus]